MKHETKSQLIEEVHGLITEGVFNSRWTLLETYHEVGKLLKKEEDLASVAHAIGQRTKTLHYAVELYKAYPNLNSLPEGKNASWHKVCKLLPPYEKEKEKPKSKRNTKG